MNLRERGAGEPDSADVEIRWDSPSPETVAANHAVRPRQASAGPQGVPGPPASSASRHPIRQPGQRLFPFRCPEVGRLVLDVGLLYAGRTGTTTNLALHESRGWLEPHGSTALGRPGDVLGLQRIRPVQRPSTACWCSVCRRRREHRAHRGAPIGWAGHGFGDASNGKLAIPQPPPGIGYVRVKTSATATGLLRSDGRIVVATTFTPQLPQTPLPPPGLRLVDFGVTSNQGAGILSDGSLATWGAAAQVDPPYLLAWSMSRLPAASTRSRFADPMAWRRRQPRLGTIPRCLQFPTPATPSPPYLADANGPLGSSAPNAAT